MNALPENQKDVMQALLSMLESTEKAKGCLSHHVFRNIEDENFFSLIEEWQSHEDLKDHVKSDRFSVLLGTKGLLCEPPHIQIDTVSHSEGMETVNAARAKITH